MENEQLDSELQEQPPYTPRPRWQVWTARVAVLVFIILLILYYVNLFRGGI